VLPARRSRRPLNTAQRPASRHPAPPGDLAEGLHGDPPGPRLDLAAPLDGGGLPGSSRWPDASPDQSGTSRTSPGSSRRFVLEPNEPRVQALSIQAFRVCCSTATTRGVGEMQPRARRRGLINAADAGPRLKHYRGRRVDETHAAPCSPRAAGDRALGASSSRFGPAPRSNSTRKLLLTDIKARG